MKTLIFLHPYDTHTHTFLYKPGWTFLVARAHRFRCSSCVSCNVPLVRRLLSTWGEFPMSSCHWSGHQEDGNMEWNAGTISPKSELVGQKKNTLTLQHLQNLVWPGVIWFQCFSIYFHYFILVSTQASAFRFWMFLLVAQEIFAIHDGSPTQRHGGSGLQRVGNRQSVGN